MPVKFWEEHPDGSIGSRIITGWDTTYYGEEFRPDAEDLDQQLDGVLDAAVELTRTTPVATVSADPKFKMIWRFGRTVKDSGVLTHPALKTEKQRLLWRAMAAKARLGISADFPTAKTTSTTAGANCDAPAGNETYPTKAAESKTCTKPPSGYNSTN